MQKPRQIKNTESESKGQNEDQKPLRSGEMLDPLQEELKQKVGDLLPTGSRDEILRRITTVIYSERFQGPIAHPRHLREYENILPGAADRIIGMAEAQQQHQITMDRSVVQHEYSDRRVGMIIGALLFAALILCGLVLALRGNDLAAGLFLTTAAIGGVGLFVNGRKSDDQK